MFKCKKGILVLNPYMSTVPGWPLTASRWPNIIFDKRIEIQTLINLCLDIYKGILVINPYINIVPGWPLAASSSLQVAKYYF